jgi:hypothetical protein
MLPPSSLAHRALFDALLVLALDQAVHVDAGQVDVVGVELPVGTISSTSASRRPCRTWRRAG